MSIYFNPKHKEALSLLQQGAGGQHKQKMSLSGKMKNEIAFGKQKVNIWKQHKRVAGHWSIFLADSAGSVSGVRPFPPATDKGSRRCSPPVYTKPSDRQDLHLVIRVWGNMCEQIRGVLTGTSLRIIENKPECQERCLWRRAERWRRRATHRQKE